MHFSKHIIARLKAPISVFIKADYYPACFIDRSPLGGDYSVLFLRYYSIDADMASVSWRGVPLSEIIGSQSPWGAPEFPLVTPSRHHTVLYHISNDGNIGDRPPKPHRGRDIWDNGHVRLPCSDKSLYPVEDSNGETYLKKRWEMIEEALRKPISNSHKLADAILSYNIKFKDKWKFRALHTLFNEHLDEDESNYFFNSTLPLIAKLALDLPKLVQAPIPLLKQDKNHSISLSQQQIASLLANAFFCTFPRRNSNKRTSEYSAYPHINFSSLYESEGHGDILEKLKCICHYFRRVCTKVPGGVVTLSRRWVPPRSCPAWAQSGAALAALPLHVDAQGTIEDASGLIQMDFANMYLGGGVLGHGSVQEEIRFVICPELMISMLFTEVLGPNEALIIIGCERYSRYVGYGHGFGWAGDFRDEAPRDSSGRKRCAVLALDALPFSDRALEYRRDNVVRELNKAWVGFSFYSADTQSLQFPGVATGNWGCGVFGGSPQLKSLIQMMACAVARRPMAYYTFGDTELRDEIINVYNILARYNVTVGQLYRYILRFSTTDVLHSHLHSFIQQALIDESKTPRRSSRVEANKTTLTLEPKPEEKQKNDSPDLFSQDEELSEPILVESSIETDDGNKMAVDMKMASDNKIVPDNQMASGNKMASENKMAHTSRLLEEMEKLDEESGQLNLSTNSRDLTNEYSRFFEHKSTPNKMAPKGMPTSSFTLVNEKSSKPGNTSKVLDSGENCIAISNSKNKKIKVPDSDDDMSKSEVPAEIKKKLTKKITDYFSKKKLYCDWHSELDIG
ncbi:poly(ADP-ribose) glycohydrolase [Hyposmocoma kahamanoa]|uniref:poly(ADP-ribose) glycohydrolase n=1 Tax=Hyposmocoma kahamanoa TaxID=1477025 RepID=UPI000E6D64D3|nr:poly(ADP-ribose) glycohydrolase [Hyposmocoma kahamanoa]